MAAPEPQKLERIVKGFANHNRIRALMLLNQQPGLSVSDIAAKLRTDINNTSQHLAKMAVADLVAKQHDGAEVKHYLTTRGKVVLDFLISLP
ncbi:MarR family transcriptional regulator [Candidatus Microgenomates bacterium]|nr:MarR family transcriptional regulator [Candidatus Microgenomates bacterium]